jgi:hypothetical protein
MSDRITRLPADDESYDEGWERVTDEPARPRLLTDVARRWSSGTEGATTDRCGADGQPKLSGVVPLGAGTLGGRASGRRGLNGCARRISRPRLRPGSLRSSSRSGVVCPSGRWSTTGSTTRRSGWARRCRCDCRAQRATSGRWTRSTAGCRSSLRSCPANPAAPGQGRARLRLPPALVGIPVDRGHAARLRRRHRHDHVRRRPG